MSLAPLASVACAKVGVRVTSITGAVLVSGGFIISIFANSVVFLYISMGVIVGELKNAVKKNSLMMLCRGISISGDSRLFELFFFHLSTTMFL